MCINTPNSIIPLLFMAIMFIALSYRQHYVLQTAEDNGDCLLTWPGLLWLDLVTHFVIEVNSCK